MLKFKDVIENTYWNSKGTHQELTEKLSKLIPNQGSVEKPRSTNKFLERFRKAQNCYYDLFNNGLCNRAQEFARVFRFPSSQYRRYDYDFSNDLYQRVEKEIDQIILDAAKEQGLI